MMDHGDYRSSTNTLPIDERKANNALNGNLNKQRAQILSVEQFPDEPFTGPLTLYLFFQN